MSWFGKRPHDPQLLTPSDHNPLLQWEGALRYADQCKARGAFREGRDALRRLLDQVRDLSGPGRDKYLPITLGRLGECLFHGGEVEAARVPMQQALALCEGQRDVAGILAYLGNLYELQRYAGEWKVAADTLERVARTLEQFGKPELAHARRRQAALVRAGEPLCRVVLEVDGESYETDSAPRFGTARIRFNLVRNRISLRASSFATTLGTEAGSRGEYNAALAHFEQAAAADRFDPAPHFHAGLTLLHLQRYDAAVVAYAQTEQRAPGYYQVRSDRWLAERLARGALPHHIFMLLRRLVDGAVAPDGIISASADALRSAPIAPLYLVRGEAFLKLQRRGEAKEAFRQGLATAEEPDVRTRLLTALGGIVGDRSEKVDLLHEAQALRGNLVAAAMAQLMLREVSHLA